MPRAVDLTLEVLKADDIFPIPDRKSRMKWNGPWWHMAALYEMGESARIPESAVIKALALLKNGAWPRFVIRREDAPRRDSDRAKMDCCHCELGVFYMILASCGCDVDAVLPWIRDWLLQHQLPDGGLNCSPAAYRESGKAPSYLRCLRWKPFSFSPTENTRTPKRTSWPRARGTSLNIAWFARR